ncbi:hypothetical protein, partial [Methanonatronarchaeum thermophilum]|uniref:hypothetical protein n=1 Tax=Methanonatronarchaeum thermophilum TaxID=1927129 RepID=UPI00117A8301
MTLYFLDISPTARNRGKLWVGADVAMAFSITVATLIAYYYLNRLISIKLPFRELGKEVFAALI